MNHKIRPSVWIDGVVFENDYQLGIWRLFYEVMSRTADRVDYTLWLRSPPRRPLPSGVRVIRDAGRWIGAPWDPISYARKMASRFPIPAGLREVDVFHSTYFTCAPIVGPIQVVSVYDMIIE